MTLDAGLPPIAAIVAVDVAGSRAAVDERFTGDVVEFQRGVAALLNGALDVSGGHHLRIFGDGGIAALPDPEAAVSFARNARDSARGIGPQLRIAIHLGRVEFVHGEPVGPAFFAASSMVSLAEPDQIVGSRTLVDVLGDGCNATPLGHRRLAHGAGDVDLFMVP